MSTQATIARKWWLLSLMGTMGIFAAAATQVGTLSWRNWIILSGNSSLHIGLWGACGQHECYTFHADGHSLPWHLQAAVFLVMICICVETLTVSLCCVELFYLWNRKRIFPLKRIQMYLAVVAFLLAIMIAGVVGLLVISGHEQEIWEFLHSKMLLPGGKQLGSHCRFSVSQAWGFQVLSAVFICCYIMVANVQMNHTRPEILATSVEDAVPVHRRSRILMISPNTNTEIQRTPPPAYSPPPAYGVDCGDLELGAESEILQENDTHFVEDSTSFTLLL